MMCLTDPMCLDAALLGCLADALRAMDLFGYHAFGAQWSGVGDVLYSAMAWIFDSLDTPAACAAAVDPVHA